MAYNTQNSFLRERSFSFSSLDFEPYVKVAKAKMPVDAMSISPYSKRSGIIMVLGCYGFGLGDTRADLASPNLPEPTMNTNPETNNHSLQLTVEEALIHHFDHVSIHPEIQPDSYCLVVKIFTSKTPKPELIGNVMKDAWIACFPFTFTDYHSGQFLVKFGCEGDKRRVVEGQPWHFDSFLMLFAIPDGFDTILPNQLRYIPLWL
uniref:DUF4283 domain-containing protein n=1 Tax=Cannabis sativa TaxID=3483 RepID=A0A803NIX5_CANSA